MSVNILHIKRKIVTKLKRITAWLILFIAAVLPWRLRVLFCDMLSDFNYKKRSADRNCDRVTDFFFE